MGVWIEVSESKGWTSPGFFRVNKSRFLRNVLKGAVSKKIYYRPSFRRKHGTVYTPTIKLIHFIPTPYSLDSVTRTLIEGNNTGDFCERLNLSRPRRPYPATRVLLETPGVGPGNDLRFSVSILGTVTQVSSVDHGDPS